jgi:hypothetical protein
MARQAIRGRSGRRQLTKVPLDRETETVLESERQARALEANDRLASEESRLWDSTLGDGVD